ncbi:MazG nucleotide pyrophosphohydrolase domain-containing protein [Corynebacterium lizhenjunii]|uniref:MazG nucleotide pyrophosphohydrolase domain-containing protein n=1 Tax=Corynebacterium lizhenjunii TaxID=2709394 RepID=UPI0013EDE9E8|nr:MazG nucleotide pyrophosphohydrolase domain-containing protein [Corynebacterium lizhenjunii]
MTVVLLDPRWPTLIPLEAYSRVAHPISYSGEVPVAVRWNFGDLISAQCPRGIGTVVSTDANDAEVRRRQAAGEEVIEAPSRRDPVWQAQQTMQRARDIGEWEMSQTHATLLPYLEEEAGEFAQAVRLGADDAALCQELGDLLLQVLFHAEIASRRGAFDFAAVAQSFVDKMRARAPYLFDGSTAVVPTEVQESLWQAAKAGQR